MISTYTDGSCIGNNRLNNCKGSFAFVILRDNVEIHRYSKAVVGTTNNRMEMSGVISAMEYLLQFGGEEIRIITDSRYVVDNWDCIPDWKKRCWKRVGGKPVLNDDLWKRIDELYPRFEKLSFHWVKGHGDNQYNNLVDLLARQAT